MYRLAIRKPIWVLMVACAATVWADGPADNLVDKVRPIPPVGVTLPAETAKALLAGANELAKEIDAIRASAKGQQAWRLELLPDVQIFHKAVDWAVRYGEFFDIKEIDVATKLLSAGMERAKQLKEGKTPWTTATGLVVRGYVSRIDGSIQPYGLVVPASYRAPSAHAHRLDLWWHGRGEKLSELNFLNDRRNNPGQFTPAHAFVLHPYGRYCNANKFAGEVDTFEAIEQVRKHYAIDPNRIVARGFSMGGAACWQYATHFPDYWAAAAPGAGFAESADFLKVFQSEKIQPTLYEKALWNWYDCTVYARNLANLPTVAYSGEMDKQKQAADIMADAMKKEGLHLIHLIGPNTAHSYHEGTKRLLNERIDAIVARGRNPVPKNVEFVTSTLRYHRSFWVHVTGLQRHWQPSRVSARLIEPSTVRAETKNITGVSFQFGPGELDLLQMSHPKIEIDGVSLTGPAIGSDRSWRCSLQKDGAGVWRIVGDSEKSVLAKRPGLQGPIDDAFCDRFVMVLPTGKPMYEKTGAWVAAESKHAVEHWRKHFRGDALVKTDQQIQSADMAGANLILWGDPSSNAVLARVLGKLKENAVFTWTNDQVGIVGVTSLPASNHVLSAVYPNPFYPTRYVVFNSGFTFREYDYLNNARQTAKLPDWALLDILTPANSRFPARVAAADFFSETWRPNPANFSSQ